MQKTKRHKFVSYLGLGSNVGEKIHNLKNAKEEITRLVGDIVLESSFYSTEAWGYKEQDTFINQVICVHTKYDPWKLLKRLQNIEKELFKDKKIHWGPRRIDIDVLYYDEKIIYEKRLIIPHPYMYLRNFVLAPLVEIAPYLKHPLLHKTSLEMLKDCKDRSPVIPLDELNGQRKQ